jgi:hypothetical protein
MIRCGISVLDFPILTRFTCKRLQHNARKPNSRGGDVCYQAFSDGSLKILAEY